MSDIIKLQKYLTLNIQEAPEGAPARMVRLSQVSLDGGAAQTIQEFPVKRDLNMHDFARQVYDSAKNDADSIGETVRYEVRVYHGQSTVAQNRHAFRILGELQNADPEEGRGPVGEFSEGATDKGRVSQAMRHTESIMRLGLGGFSEVMKSMRDHHSQLQDELSRLRADNKRLMDSREEMIRAYEATLSEANDRELERYKVMMAQKERSEMIQKILMLMPFVVNKIAGKKLLPEGTVDATREVMKELLASIKDDQFQKIAGALSPEQQMAFAQVYETFMSEEMAKQQKEEEEKARMKQVANGVEARAMTAGKP